MAFGAASIAFWALAAWALLDAMIGPCGWGPDAPCEGHGKAYIGLLLVVAIISYAALCVVFLRKSKRGL